MREAQSGGDMATLNKSIKAVNLITAGDNIHRSDRKFLVADLLTSIIINNVINISQLKSKLFNWHNFCNIHFVRRGRIKKN
jgi:hypothetical protein